MLNAARKRANKLSLPFNIIASDIHIPNHCPCCDGPITKISDRHRTGRAVASSPSLDRLIPELGYTKNNIMVICQKCNLKKRDLTLSDLENLASYIRRGCTPPPPMS